MTGTKCRRERPVENEIRAAMAHYGGGYRPWLFWVRWGILKGF